MSFDGGLFFRELCKSLASKAAPLAFVLFGEDSTSCSLDGGSFLFSFQIPVEDQGKDDAVADPQPAAPLIFGLAEG